MLGLAGKLKSAVSRWWCTHTGNAQDEVHRAGEETAAAVEYIRSSVLWPYSDHLQPGTVPTAGGEKGRERRDE